MAGMAVQSRVEDEALGTHVVDEFTAPGEQRSLLELSRGRVQALFPVIFTVLGCLENPSDEEGKNGKNPGRIWLQLKGRIPAVVKAKEYVKGLCEPEMEIREGYPKEMHCIFASAQGLFLNRLIMDTCAHIAMVEIGILSIKGGTEPVVMAQSQIQQFVRLFRNNENLSHDREPEVKRRFKQFVEANADKYTMDLLILPSTLKEELLNLTSEAKSCTIPDCADLEIATVNTNAVDQADGSRCTEQSRVGTRTPVTELTKQLDSVFSSVPKTLPNPPLVPLSHQERSSVKRRYSESEERCLKKPFSLECIQVDGPISRVTDPSDIPIIDLVSDSGEDSLIIVEDDATVSAETEYKILVNFFKTMGYSKEVVEKVIRNFGQSEEPLRLLEEIEKESNKVPSRRESQTGEQRTAQDLNVPKKESRPQQEVMVEPISTHAFSNGDLLKYNSRKHNPLGTEGLKTQRPGMEGNLLKNFSFVARGASSPPRNRQVSASEEPGPSNLPPVKVIKQIPVKGCTPMYPPRPVQNAVKPSVSERPDKQKPSVTGVQMFLNSIKTPYKLELKNEPGGAELRHIIIDGSNVAISHGLQRFFSCRGIAIAVEYFWKLGHRKITVFVPQWRTKRDPNITEQHFLQQLEELGILSFTPSRTVLGSRIAAHDDRFLLHLAEKTEGIIVTNDNLREFVVETPAWTQIIKDRLLQFTFAGDIFMIPDDPLGRHGPNLEDFLSTRPVLHRDHPLTPHPSDSGVFFPSQDTSLSGIFPVGTDHSHPRAFLPIDKKPVFSAAIQKILRPQAIVPPQRTYQETVSLKDALLKIFPESQQKEKIEQVLSAHPYMRDLNALSAMILD
ncbi:NEDD4-binding protein 1 isoform X1 [Eleutherodactylus coqui]|uniref:NEDD4-binding protein 1 isoform X1 n=1 Tax=Eleutherodactylus coqui TaxID=57060 RepID=UPI0034627460